MPQALNTISGQPWANFGTMNVATGAMFMNSVGQQMALARGAAAAGQRVALAEACDVASCDGPGPWSAWLSAVGGLGSVQGNRNASTFTYNAGGAAAGLDYRFDPRFLVGLSVGYTHGTQWTNGFMGQGWSDTVSVAAYGSFTQGGFYVDALAGYARSTNQLQRQIVFPNLQPRTANGSAGANQFLGQAEAGYRFGIYAPAQASLTPFARVAVQSVTQNAFSESGANSLSLNVAQQGTNSLRSTIGAELAGELPLGSESKLAPGAAAGLAARVRRHQPADQRRLRRRAGQRLHRLRRHAVARQCRARLPGQHHHRRGHLGLPALRRRDRRRHRQPRHQSRTAGLLVASAALATLGKHTSPPSGNGGRPRSMSRRTRSRRLPKASRMPRLLSSPSSSTSMSQAMMSTSWMAAPSTTTAVTGWAAPATSASMRSRNSSQLAKKSGAAKR